MKVQGSLDNSMASRMTQAVSGAQAERAESASRAGGEEAGKAFEAYFATLLVKQLRSSLPDGFFSGSGSDVYAAWFDEHIGQSLADRNALGFAGIIKASMGRGALILPGDDLELVTDDGESQDLELPEESR